MGAFHPSLLFSVEFCLLVPSSSNHRHNLRWMSTVFICFSHVVQFPLMCAMFACAEITYIKQIIGQGLEIFGSFILLACFMTVARGHHPLCLAPLFSFLPLFSGTR